MNKVGHKDIIRIIEGCIQCDPLSQRNLYDLLFDNILRTVSSFHLSKVETEDLIQESFIKIFNNIKSYDSTKSQIQTWANIIAKRITLNHIQAKKIEIVDQDISELYQEFYATVEDSDPKETHLILSAIESLPNQYKEVFEMAVFQGMEHKNISERLGISASSSRVYLTRAKKILQKDMTKLGIQLHS